MIVAENDVSFNRLEKEIYKICCGIGCIWMQEILNSFDKKLCTERDKRRYRHKGKRPATIKTLMGEVEYARAVYEVNEDGRKQYIYLLDEILGRETVGAVSSMLAEKIAESCCEMPYRKAALAVSGMTGQVISHTGAWNVVQSLGKQIDAKENAATTRAKEGKGSGGYESKLLFEEQDGIYLNLQGKDRKKHGVSKEMKLAIAYDGAKKIGGKRYELCNKVACANFEGSEKFYERKEGVIAGYYSTDEIEMRILNGDGASWIRRSVTDETVHYQLDTFHRNRAVLRQVRRPEARAQIMRLLYGNNSEETLEYIKTLGNSVEEKEREDLLQLYHYFKNNQDGLRGYHQRGLELPKVKDGMVYRRCGAMESNVFSLVGVRMKGRRTNWSIRGGNNLARLLCLKVTKRLSETLQGIIGIVLDARYTMEITEKLSAGRIPESAGKGYDGFTQALIAPSIPWLKEIVRMRSLSDIKF